MKKGEEKREKIVQKTGPARRSFIHRGKKNEFQIFFFWGGGEIIKRKNIYHCRCIMDFLLIDQLTLLILGEILKFLTIQTVLTHVYLLHYAYFYDYDPFTYRTFILLFL